ncbi:hypothetical protein B0H15DRAFT_932493 [Mycena belliarum]|uniref:Bacteriophage T5 Orf172 DNA-binding domain-containing protein n=1 Tax=Mycena belliarum TaxID=1033014 RepID=A0AAD6TY06_9AGAR|nr:hypothetical protein B0H15DRAFT_932493 [Mycena belliae]
MASTPPTFLDCTPRPLVLEVLKQLRTLAGRDPLDAAEAYLNLRPYLEPPAGNVYVFLQLNEAIVQWIPHAPLGLEIDTLDLKVGKANDVDARRAGHEAQCPGIQRVWAYHYQTNYPKLLERLVHLSLKDLQAQRPIRSCEKCSVHHREFYGEEASGGLEGVAEIIEYWLKRIGEVPRRQALYY